MILEALVRHYGRLERDPESGLAPFGYSLQQVGFSVVLNPDGSLHAIEEQADTSGGKPRPIKLILPGQSKPSGSGINPCFLWDNPTYMLGHVPEGRDPAWATKRFEGFRDKHLGYCEQLADDAGYNAVCSFLAAWDPAMLEGRADTEPLARPGFGVFALRGDESFVHERPAVDQFWRTVLLDGGEGDEIAASQQRGGVCLVTGERGPVARLHEPKIKGVSGAQSSGATLVSFNENAYESLGLKQGEVAPVSERVAFQYATALNALLDDREHRVQLGDTTVVFWTEKPKAPEGQADPDPADALAEAFGIYREGREAEKDDTETRSALKSFLDRYRQGKADPTAAKLNDADAPFHVLGLSPNAARISVRFWMNCTVKELAERLEARSNALAIIGYEGNASPSTWQLIRSTARDSKEIRPNIAGEFIRAFLHNRSIPRSFAIALLTRVRVEGDINAIRASGLKAYILTNGIAPMDTYLNREHPSTAYHSGRILAIVGFAQEQALGDINAGVVKKNFASAMSTPGLTLGRLQRAAAVGHIPKLGDSMAEFVNDELSQANCCLRDGPPKNLGPDGQTLFALGFYQQTAYIRAVKNRVTEKHPNRSNMGEWMRSKLEVKVANALNKAGVAYVYEPSLILDEASSGMRYPDFLVRGGGVSANDTYIEVAGYPGEEYDQRHQIKLAAYWKMGITEEGGERGRLVVLDYRDKDFDDASVYDAIRFLIPAPSKTPSEDN